MAKQGAKGVVPRLRFPEFLGGEGWCATSLRRLTDLITKGTTPTSIGFQFVDQGINFIKIESIRDGAIDLSKMSAISDECHDALKRSQLKDGDLLFSIAGALGVTAVVDESILPANTNQALAIIRLKNRRSLGFIEKYLTTRAIESEIEKIRAGAAQPNISLAQVGDFSIALPSLPEQQKIADCLTSLDEVIAAQGRKVEALKAHKRGLMQQLFPREGETRPRLRFPEFRNAPEWEEESVSALISTVTPPKKIATSGYKSSGRLAIVDQSPVAVCGWTDDLSAKVDASLPLLVFGDHTCVLKLVEHDFAQGADGIKIISAKPRIDIRFLFFGLQADPIVSSSYRRHFSLLQEKSLALPRDAAEQQRIADCLSSLDTRITAETQQLAALKTHKQGLMQQLFPAPAEG